MKDTSRCLILVGFGALLGYGAFAIWPFSAFKPTTKDWVDVATALGTCSAVVVALYIAISDRLRSDRRDRIDAHLTAASVTYRLGLLKADATEARIWVNDCIGGASSPGLSVHFSHRLQYAERCSFEEIRFLSALGEHCATRIAGAQDRIDIAWKKLQDASGAGEDEALLNLLGIVRTALLEAEGLLSHAITVCERAGGDVYLAFNRETQRVTDSV